jgi:O-antigen/teichoic acid export membrane protein
MNLRQAIFHNTTWNIIGTLLTFISNIIIVRLLGIEYSGSFFYVLALLTLVCTALKLGIENGIVFIVSGSPGSTRALFLLLFPVAVLQSLAAIVITYFLAGMIENISISWAVVFIISNIFYYYITAFYQARKMFKSLNVFKTFFTVLQTILLALLYFNKEGIYPKILQQVPLLQVIFIILTLFTALQIVVLLVYFYLKTTPSGPVYPDLPLFKRLMNFSGINYLVTILIFLISRVDFYFVEKYCDSVTFSNYSQVAKLGQIALIIPGLLGGVIFPFSVNTQEAMQGKVVFLCRLSGLFFLCFFLIVLMIGNGFFPWLLGADFNLVYKGILLSFLGVYSMAVSILLLSYFEGRNAQSIVLVSYFVTLCLIITGDYFLVEQFGYIAASLIFSVSNFAGMLILLNNFTKKAGLNWNEVLVPASTDIRRLWTNFLKPV